MLVPLGNKPIPGSILVRSLSSYDNPGPQWLRSHVCEVAHQFVCKPAPSLVHIMACRLFRSKSFPELTIIAPSITTFGDIWITIQPFSYTKTDLKMSECKIPFPRPQCVETFPSICTFLVILSLAICFVHVYCYVNQVMNKCWSRFNAHNCTIHCINVCRIRASWRLKSPVTRTYVQPFNRDNEKDTSKLLHYGSFFGESTNSPPKGK